MKYRIQAIGRVFSDKAIKDLEDKLNRARLRRRLFQRVAQFESRIVHQQGTGSHAGAGGALAANNHALV